MSAERATRVSPLVLRACEHSVSTHVPSYVVLYCCNAVASSFVRKSNVSWEEGVLSATAEIDIKWCISAYQPHMLQQSNYNNVLRNNYIVACWLEHMFISALL